MRVPILTFALIILASISFAQESVLEDHSISNQFDQIYKTSSSYEVYKVILKKRYLQLKQHVLDSVAASQDLVLEKIDLLKAEKENSKKTREILHKTKLDLEMAIQKENLISFLGLQVSKTAYHLNLWTCVLLLLFALVCFIFKFTKSNILTKKAQDNLQSQHSEYEQYKKKSIEREQKLRRELQDEINKQRKV